jgi:hypothetical protein
METRVFIRSRARGADNPRCAKWRSHYDPTSGNGMPSAHDAGGRLVQWTAGRRRSSRESGLIIKSSPRITVNWPALASSILEDWGSRFYKSEVRSDLASAQHAGSASGKHSPRAREGLCTKIALSQSSRSVFVQASTSARKPILVESRTMRSAASGGVSKARTSKIAPT